jgi:hypothetical protein
MQFSAKDWDRIRHDWTAWWHHEIDRPMVIVNAIEFEGIEAFFDTLETLL